MKRAILLLNSVKVVTVVLMISFLWYLRGVMEWSFFVGGLVLIGVHYFLYEQWVKDHYLERKKISEVMRTWAIFLMVDLFFIIFLGVFGLSKINFLRISFALICSVVILFLPVMVAEVLNILNSVLEDRYLKTLKSFYPWHRVFVQKWEKGDLRKRIDLLLIEPDVIETVPLVQELLKQWLMIDDLDLVTLIKKDKRHLYRFLIDKDESKMKLLLIEQIEEGPTELVMTVKTEGDLLVDTLLSGKARAKILEFFAVIEKPVRSFSYNQTTRQIVIQFFLKGDEMPAEILEIAQKLELGFTELNIKNNLSVYPKFEEYEIIDQEETMISGQLKPLVYSVKISYKLPSGLPVELISSSKIESLASYIRRPLYQHKLHPYDDVLELYVEMATRNMSKLRYVDFPPAEGLRIALGFDLKYRKPVFINFDQAEVKEGDPGFTPHLLIAGATASGKSSFIKFIIMQLLRSHAPDSLRFFMVDPKVVTFRIFNKLPHLYAPIVSEADKFQVILNGIVEEVEKRYKILAEADVENIYQLYAKHPDKAKEMPRILVIVDEFADIIDSHSWNVREQIVLTLKRLGQKARAAGIHLIMITQRATSTNIDSEVKANISGRISFKVASEGDSQVILESSIAADIQNPGEGYARLGDSDELVHFQAPYVSDTEMREAMHKYEGIPQEFLDQTLTEELLKKPLKPEEVTLDMLPETCFPIVPVGVSLDSHKPIFLMLSRPEVKSHIEPTPHLIVAGATNSGKSQFAKLLITRLVLSGEPDLVKLILIDPKAVSFVPFKKLPHLACPLLVKHFQLLPLIKELLKLIEERYEIFSEHEVENIEEYRAKVGKKLSSYVVIIDEFADLLDYYDYRERDEIEKILKRFGQMARAAGVHLIIVTQRATSQNISGEIRANFSGRMAFRMNSEADSFYILEESGADKLLSAGRFLFRKAHYDLETGYSPMMTEDQIHQTVDSLIAKYGEVQYEKRLVDSIPLEDKASTSPDTW